MQCWQEFGEIQRFYSLLVVIYVGTTSLENNFAILVKVKKHTPCDPEISLSGISSW